MRKEEIKRMGLTVKGGPIRGVNVTSGDNPGHEHSDITTEISDAIAAIPAAGAHVEGGNITTTSDIEGTITFNEAFDDTFYVLSLTLYDNAGIATFPAPAITTVKISNKTVTGFDYVIESAAATTIVEWMAVSIESTYTSGPIEEEEPGPGGGGGY